MQLVGCFLQLVSGFMQLVSGFMKLVSGFMQLAAAGCRHNILHFRSLFIALMLLNGDNHI